MLAVLMQLNCNAHIQEASIIGLIWEDMMKIAVIGAGQMGNGIAQVAASAGYEVLMIDIKEEYVDRGMAPIQE